MITLVELKTDSNPLDVLKFIGRINKSGTMTAEVKEELTWDGYFRINIYEKEDKTTIKPTT